MLLADRNQQVERWQIWPRHCGKPIVVTFLPCIASALPCGKTDVLRYHGRALHSRHRSHWPWLGDWQFKGMVANGEARYELHSPKAP